MIALILTIEEAQALKETLREWHKVTGDSPQEKAVTEAIEQRIEDALDVA